MRHQHLVIALGLVGLGLADAHLFAQSQPSTAACDTVFAGPPGAPWQHEVNWTNGIPRAGMVACFPDAATAAATTGGMALGNVTVRVTGRAMNPRHTEPATAISQATIELRRIGDRPGDTHAAEETIVYENSIPFIAAMHIPGPGERMADDLLLSSGPCLMPSYLFAVFGQGFSGATFDVFAEMWDGNPCDPGSSPIAGTDIEVIGLPNDGATAWFLEVILSEPVFISSSVWLAVTFSTDDSGWLLGQEAEIGYTADLWSEDDKAFGCILRAFSDGNYGGFLARVTCGEASDTSVVPRI